MSRNQPSFTKLAFNPGFPFWIVLEEISSKAARQIQKRKSGFKAITETDAIYKLSQKNLAGKFILSNRYCLQLDLHNNTDPKSWPSLVNYVYKPSPTWVARCIDCCAKEENILSEGGMEDVNGSHPPPQRSWTPIQSEREEECVFHTASSALLPLEQRQQCGPDLEGSQEPSDLVCKLQ